jgi:hypothetical protein
LYLLSSSNQRNHFTLDPNFPSRLLRSGNQRTIEFICFLFEDYSKRELTKKTDKCVAISGIEARVKGALRCESRYGIFQKYIHRNLLWKASDSKMEEIAYKRHVPSWSWMAYNGGVKFLDIPVGKVSWINTLRFDPERENALIADVGDFLRCTMELEEKQFTVSDSSGTRRGWIQYDVVDGEELFEEQCVVLGRNLRNDEEYYILVVRPTTTGGEYKRVGIGQIHSSCVVRRRSAVRIV